jgi:cytochrome c5
MKTIIFFLIIFTGIIQACQQKALPTITTRTTEPSRPVIAVADIKPDIAIGKIIFTNRCGRCHALPEPVQFTAQRWDGILARMIPRARLDKEQEIHVTAFIKENCIK